MKKFILGLLGLVLLTTGVWLGVQISRYGGLVTRRFSQGEIQVVDVFPVINVFNTHADYPRLLLYKGQRFETLQGSFPYFIEVPKLHSILFLVGNNERPESALVLLDLNSDKPTYVPMGGVVIGTYGFGGINEGSIRVSYADQAKLILEDASGSATKAGSPLTYEIDLRLKTIERK